MRTIIPLLIELADDVVISETAATVGAHRSLDYVPGAALLGAAASRGYGDAATGFRRFHSGQVRFANGYPAVQSNDGWRRLLPMPLAAHSYKDDSTPIPLAKMLNLSVATPAADRQVVQARQGFLPPDLEAAVAPHLHYGMKTAISGATGRSRDAQLFGYQSISARQRFVAAVEADDAAEAEAVAKLLIGTIRVGRSRSAEFGEAVVRRLEGASCLVSHVKPIDELLRIWALSDLCLSNAHGCAVLDPTEADLGIGSFTVDWRRTFIRTRTYWPFNGHWRSRGIARSVIAKGSVITVRLHSASRRPKVATSTVGLFQEAGLGQVAFDPELLGAATLSPFRLPGLAEAKVGSPASDGRSVMPPSAYGVELLQWLDRQQRGRDRRSSSERRVASALAALQQHYAAAQRYQGRRGAELRAPTVTQWHAVATAAKAARTTEALRTRLFAEGARICAPDDQLWSGAFGRDATQCFRAWLESLLGGEEAPRVIALVARAAADHADAWAQAPADAH